MENKNKNFKVYFMQGGSPSGESSPYFEKAFSKLRSAMLFADQLVNREIDYHREGILKYKNYYQITVYVYDDKSKKGDYHPYIYRRFKNICG